ncbi:T9SS type A sorting domain-containing protein [bacterium]|nr:T9SS type A sorting domain-containing protein [bacterium]
MLKKGLPLILLLAMIVTISADPIDIVGSRSGFFNAQRLYYLDNLVFILDYFNLYVFDVSDPSSPDSIGAFHFDNYTLGIDISGDWAYITYGQKIGLVDISDPGAPNLVDNYNVTNYSYDVKVMGRAIFVANMARFLILQHTLTDTIGFLGQVSVARDNKALDIVGGVAYLGLDQLGFYAYSITDPTSPRLLSGRDTPGWAVGVEVLDNYAFVADASIVGVPGEASLRIMDIRNASAITEVGHYISYGGSVLNCFPVSHYVIIADGTAGVKILDVEYPSALELIGELSDIGFVNDVAYEDEYLFVLSRNTFYVCHTDLIDTTGGTEIDTIPPTGAVLEPLPGSYSSCSDQPVKFILRDNDEIDPTSIRLMVNSSIYSLTDSRLSYSEDTLVFQPFSGWWIDGEEINYSLTDAADMEGNCADGLPYSGSFTVDISFPIIENPVPAPGITVSTNTPLIHLDISDDYSGVDPASLALQVLGTVYYLTDPALSYSGNTLTFDPAVAGIAWEDTTTAEVCLVQAADHPDYCEPNSIGEYYCWEFSIASEIINETDGKIPSFNLFKTYPNPFNSQINFEFELTQPALINIQIYDINGLLIDNICDRVFSAGNHLLPYLISKTDNHNVNSGIYFISIQAGQKRIFKKVILMK